MTASAQQRVPASLDALRSESSSALARVEKAEARDAQLTGLQASECKLIGEQLGRREALTIDRAAKQES